MSMVYNLLTKDSTIFWPLMQLFLIKGFVSLHDGKYIAVQVCFFNSLLQYERRRSELLSCIKKLNKPLTFSSSYEYGKKVSLADTKKSIQR